MIIPLGRCCGYRFAFELSAYICLVVNSATVLSCRDKISPKRIAIMYIQQDLGRQDARKES